MKEIASELWQIVAEGSEPNYGKDNSLGARRSVRCLEHCSKVSKVVLDHGVYVEGGNYEQCLEGRMGRI